MNDMTLLFRLTSKCDSKVAPKITCFRKNAAKTRTIAGTLACNANKIGEEIQTYR